MDARPNEKQCRRCQSILPLDSFYVHSQMADGHLNVCKLCVKARVRKHYAEHRNRYHAYERVRNSQPERREKQREYSRRRTVVSPEKKRARTAVGNAIRDGRLQREPCHGCGTEIGVQAHHADYSKPLEVDWLCFKCHREIAHGQTVTFIEGEQMTP